MYLRRAAQYLNNNWASGILGLHSHFLSPYFCTLASRARPAGQETCTTKAMNSANLSHRQASRLLVAFVVWLDAGVPTPVRLIGSVIEQSERDGMLRWRWLKRT